MSMRSIRHLNCFYPVVGCQQCGNDAINALPGPLAGQIHMYYASTQRLASRYRAMDAGTAAFNMFVFKFVTLLTLKIWYPLQTANPNTYMYWKHKGCNSCCSSRRFPRVLRRGALYAYIQSATIKIINILVLSLTILSSSPPVFTPLLLLPGSTAGYNLEHTVMSQITIISCIQAKPLHFVCISRLLDYYLCINQSTVHLIITVIHLFSIKKFGTDLFGFSYHISNYIQLHLTDINNDF